MARFVVYNANTGPDRSDIDRRHLFKVPVTGRDAGAAHDRRRHRMESGRHRRRSDRGVSRVRRAAAAAPAVVPIAGGSPRAVAGESPAGGLSRGAARTPEAGGVPRERRRRGARTAVRARRRRRRPRSAGRGLHPRRRPRQMLLGWHYRWEYANDYGANQYLASRGFIVLSVDYRLERRLRPGVSVRGAHRARAARRNISTSSPPGAICRRAPTSIRAASASGARRTAAT